jgi:hypothetical protein
MATLIQFNPSATANFQFQATLDGQNYIVVVTWNLFGQRYYINIYDTSGVLKLAMPLVGSPNDYDISMTAGYFTTKLVYRVQSNNFEVI